MVSKISKTILAISLACLFAPQTALAAPILETREDVDGCFKGGPPLVSSGLLGDPDGNQGPSRNYFCATKWDQKNSASIIGIEMWAARFNMHAIRLSYSDGSKSDMIGQIPNDYDADEHNHVTWDATQTLDQLTVWKNRDGNAVGSIRVHVKGTGKPLQVSSGHNAHDDGDDAPVGAGILVGVTGTSWEYVHNLKFWFLNSPIAKAEVISMDFDESLDTLNRKQEGITSFLNAHHNFTNEHSSSNQTWSFANQISQQNQFSHTTDTISTFGITETVSVGATVKIPAIAEATVEESTAVAYTLTTEESFTSNKVQGVTTTPTLSGSVAPGHYAKCEGWVQSGTYNGDYTATIQMTLQNGLTYNIRQRGTINTLSYTTGSTKCPDYLLDGSDAPGAPKSAQTSIQKSAQKSNITSRDTLSAPGPVRLL